MLVLRIGEAIQVMVTSSLNHACQGLAISKFYSESFQYIASMIKTIETLNDSRIRPTHNPIKFVPLFLFPLDGVALRHKPLFKR